MFSHTGRVFEIYSIGDGLYMQRILNGVAAMSNDGLLLQLVALGLIIGLLVMGVKNVMAGGMKLEIGTFLASFLLAVFLFGLRADVVVNDMSYVPGRAVQGDYTVANLPFGVAALGSLISTVGYTLTEKMEQGFSIPSMEHMGMATGGFGKTLEWVNSVRLWETPGRDTSTSKDLMKFRSNLNAYILECTLPGVEMGHICLDKVRVAPDALTYHTQDCTGGIGYASNYRMVEFVTGYGGVGSGGKNTTTLTCNAAFQELHAQAAPGHDAFLTMLGSSFKEMGGPNDAAQTFADAYQTIGVDAGNVMGISLANAVGASLDLSMRTYENRIALTKMSELMLEQASQQRLVQWAAEETMFRRIMRPMMAFFESLMYALAPFMALAVGLGTFGIATVFRYMMLTVWVSLWMPVLAIIQLFQITAMQHVVHAMQSAPMMNSDAAGITSISSAHMLRSEALEWMASGAALAAWTPAITMALVFSGAITASALAGKMQGQDTIQEKMAAPDVVNTPPAIQRGSMGEYTQGGGGRMADTSQPQVNWGSIISHGQTSTNQEQEQIASSAVQTVSQTVSDGLSKLKSSDLTRGLNRSGGASHSEDGVVSSGRGSGWDKGNDSATRAQYDFYSQLQSTIFGGGQLGFGKGGAGASIGGRMEGTEGQRSGTSVSAGDAVREQESGSTAFRTGASRQVFDKLESLVNAAVRDGVQGASELKDVLQNARQEMVSNSSTRGYSEASSLQSSQGFTQTETIGQASQRAMRMAGGGRQADEAIQMAVAATNSGAAYRAALVDATKNWGMSGHQASVAAGIAALSGHYDSYGSVQSEGGMTSLQNRSSHLLDALDGKYGGGALPTQGYIQPDTHRGVSGDSPNSKADVLAKVGDPPGPKSTPASIKAATAAGPGDAALTQTPGSVNGGRVSHATAQNGGVITNTVADGEKAISGQNVSSAQQVSDKMEEQLARNPVPTKDSNNISYPNPNGPAPYWPKDIRALDIATQYDGTIPYLQKSGGSEANVPQFNAALAAVQNKLPGETDLVQQTVAANSLAARGGLPESVRTELNERWRNGATDEEKSRMRQFTDERTGPMQQQLASAQYRAGELSREYEEKYGAQPDEPQNQE